MIIYVCSPYRGDVDENTKLARSVCREITLEGHIPIAPHIYFTQFLDDNEETERQLGMENAIKLLDLCDEIWVVGDKITPGMAAEIQYAKANDIPIMNRRHKVDRVF